MNRTKASIVKSNSPRLVELYQLIEEKQEDMLRKLAEIQNLKRDVNLDRAELVEYYREFTGWMYDAYGDSKKLFRSMLSESEMKVLHQK